ncbi:MAG TPA: SDR family NAD(P)-dependent oxidoreductase, partial [Vicinamibacterales bacterium]|nr:SDR family NAD(P)-dependent oxidoreductase [Vicinamibacterales bacterium]
MSRGWKPKKLREQTLVITGASSGIGLATARMAGARGARVVLTSRSEQDLRRATEEINARGGQATWVVADVADPTELDRVADVALSEFGGFDT